MSFEFTGDCFAGMTVLDIDGPSDVGWDKERRRPTEYVRSPAADLRDSCFTHPYREHVLVPADAIDSGHHRDDEHLWFSKDREYAYVGSRSDADAWPRAKQPIRCA